MKHKYTTSILLFIFILFFASSCIFFDDSLEDVTFIFDGKVYQQGFSPSGSIFSSYSLFPTDVGNGEILVGWYSDEACTKLFTDFLNEEEHITVYGKTVPDNNPSMTFNIRDYGRSFSVSLLKDSSVTHIDVPDTFYDQRKITSLGTSWKNYEELKTISLSSNIGVIEYGALSNTGLTELDIPEGVKTIHKNAFSENAFLEEISLPSTLKRIEADTIGGVVSYSIAQNSPKLTTINVNENNQHFKSIHGVLFSKSGTKLLLYPNGKTDIHFDVPSTVQRIEANAFSTSKHLQTISLPSTLRYIGEEAFSQTGLTEITIPHTVSELAALTFEGCANLVSINLGGVSKLAYYNGGPFEGCTSLKEIILPSTVTYLDSYIFSRLDSLEKVVIPKSVVRISDSAFYSCENVIVHIGFSSSKVPFLWSKSWYGDLRSEQIVWNSNGE